MNSKIIQPKNINLDDLDPRIDWNRPLMAPGHMGVDFETRVDFRRLHKYHAVQGIHQYKDKTICKETKYMG